MGMFDTVNLTCPECGGEIKLQTKAGDCDLNEIDEFEVPTVIALDLIDSITTCPHCTTSFRIRSSEHIPRTARLCLIKSNRYV